MEESPRFPLRPNIVSVARDVSDKHAPGNVSDKQVVAAIRAPNSATLRRWAVQVLENGVKIGTVHPNFPNRRRIALERNVNRRRVPSGEKRIQCAMPETVINFRELVPSALAR